ncbi:hypothetical protein [Nitrincola sp. A-D6]|uniref:hypothetical protein n=1 Tax=Nitrincola sp. A-D6 TaxID=1545442 RepID=UPI000AE2E896
MPDMNTAFVCSDDHQHCIDEAMSSAKALCREQQLRLTPVRELVLRLIWQSHKPLGAYDLLPAWQALVLTRHLRLFIGHWNFYRSGGWCIDWLH